MNGSHFHGYWKDSEEVRENWAISRSFKPEVEASKRSKLLTGWHEAVKRSQGWVK